MREGAFLFGEMKSLVGIVTDPHPVAHVHNFPAIILLNAGLVHRVGPNRLSVNIARRLASAGCVVLRFDLSGIGDSLVRSDSLPFEKSVVRETQEAMDFLTTARGVQRFILMGICSGANTALQVTCSDARVVGAVLMDSYAFPSIGYFLRSGSRRLLNYRTWWDVITRKSDVWGILQNSLVSQATKSTSQLHQDWEMPSKEKFSTDLHALVKRGVYLYFIYSSGSSSYYNYCVHFKDVLHSWHSYEKLYVEFFIQSDHTYTLLANQELLINRINDWIRIIV